MARRSPLSLILFALLTAVLVLPGCASQYGEQQVKVNYYPQCYQPIKELRAEENAVAKSTALGALTGAVTGAAIGYVTTGRAEGAAVGAIGGGAAGAVAGNIYGKQQQQKRDEAFYAKYAELLDADTADMNRVTAAATVAMKCYDNEFNALIRDYTAGRITIKERDQRYKEIRTGLQEISYVLNKKYDDMSKKDQEYAQALSDEYTKVKARKATAQKKNAAGQKAVASNAAGFKHAMNELEQTKARPDQSLIAYDLRIAADQGAAARNDEA